MTKPRQRQIKQLVHCKGHLSFDDPRRCKLICCEACPIHIHNKDANRKPKISQIHTKRRSSCYWLIHALSSPHSIPLHSNMEQAPCFASPSPKFESQHVEEPVVQSIRVEARGLGVIRLGRLSTVDAVDRTRPSRLGRAA